MNTTPNPSVPSVGRRWFLRWAGLCSAGTLVSVCVSACESQREQNRRMIKMLSQNQLDPASLTISKGTTVIWYNMGTWPQTATCDPAKTKNQTRVALPQGAPPWDSGELYPGQSWSYTFETPGTYVFFSRMQDTPSMVGTIKVVE